MTSFCIRSCISSRRRAVGRRTWYLMQPARWRAMIHELINWGRNSGSREDWWFDTLAFISPPNLASVEHLYRATAQHLPALQQCSSLLIGFDLPIGLVSCSKQSFDHRDASEATYTTLWRSTNVRLYYYYYYYLLLLLYKLCPWL